MDTLDQLALTVSLVKAPEAQLVLAHRIANIAERRYGVYIKTDGSYEPQERY
jgi:hypothetical protein